MVERDLSDADFHAATALALGQVLGEIAPLVGLNPDDGELYPIVDRVRRLCAERQQWVREAFRLAKRDGWSSFGTHADGRGAELEFDGEDAAGMPLWERPKAGRPARLSGSVVALPEHAYGHIANALADSPHLSEMEVLAALGVITKLIDSWRPATAEPFGVQLMREGMDRSRAEASDSQRQGVGQTVPHMTPDEEAHTFGLAAVGCPDGASCHHNCAASCWRVRTCGPLSGVYRDDRWPTGVRIAHGAPDGAGVSGTGTEASDG